MTDREAQRQAQNLKDAEEIKARVRAGLTEPEHASWPFLPSAKWPGLRKIRPCDQTCECDAEYGHYVDAAAMLPGPRDPLWRRWRWWVHVFGGGKQGTFCRWRKACRSCRRWLDEFSVKA